MSFAYYQNQCRSPWVRRRMWSGLVAALSCGLVGGCIVTSEAEFPEEQQVPPVVLDTPALPIGSIIAFDRKDGEVRLTISVRDDNLEDTLEVQAELTVVGQPNPVRVCAGPNVKINPSTEAVREPFVLLIPGASVRPGACNKVTVFVSREFNGTCTDAEQRGFGVPALGKSDLAKAQFWIWEMSRDPVSNAEAAQDLVNTCQTTIITRSAATTSTPTDQ